MPKALRQQCRLTCSVRRHNSGWGCRSHAFRVWRASMDTPALGTRIAPCMDRGIRSLDIMRGMGQLGGFHPPAYSVAAVRRRHRAHSAAARRDRPRPCRQRHRYRHSDQGSGATPISHRSSAGDRMRRGRAVHPQPTVERRPDCAFCWRSWAGSRHYRYSGILPWSSPRLPRGCRGHD